MQVSIQPFNDGLHRDGVIALWNLVLGYQAPHNNPELVIDAKVKFGDGLFLVALAGGRVIGTVMAGYDGHRGWIYAMAVSPDHRNQGIGSRLLQAAETNLMKLGCIKINLQIMADNREVERFYSSNGYLVENRISMGKRLYDPSGL